MLVTGVAFGVFMVEALVHYNLGEAKAKDAPFQFRLPPETELAKIIAVTAAASLVTGTLVEAFQARSKTPQAAEKPGSSAWGPTLAFVAGGVAGAFALPYLRRIADDLLQQTLESVEAHQREVEREEKAKAEAAAERARSDVRPSRSAEH